MFLVPIRTLRLFETQLARHPLLYLNTVAEVSGFKAAQLHLIESTLDPERIDGTTLLLNQRVHI